jgi:hypothetical protein
VLQFASESTSEGNKKAKPAEVWPYPNATVG